MNSKEAKTGQSIDVLKHGLLHPTLVESILQIPRLPTEISLIDIGTGDSTSTQDVVSSLLLKGKRIKNLGLVDADVTIFPDLVMETTIEPMTLFEMQIVQARQRHITNEFLHQYEAAYDVALSQLVLHQISNDYEVSHLMYLAYQALKPDGNLFVVNLHPNYLQYLAENEPDKFVVTDTADGRLNGKYTFDSSGSVSVHSRSIENQLAMFLSLGFDFVKKVPIVTNNIADKKPRYQALAEKNIPMFYLLQLRKNPANFISSTEGSVAQITTTNDQWITVQFSDGGEITMPEFKDWEHVHVGDHLLVQEIRRKEIKATLLNYWVVSVDEQIRGGQLVGR